MNDVKTAPEEMDSTPRIGTALEVGKVGDVDQDTEDLKVKSGMYLTQKDYHWLKKTGYNEQRRKFPKMFVLQHKKYPAKIVELRAATAAHACNFIHWKPNQVRVLEVREDDSGDVFEKGIVAPPPPLLSGSSGLV